MAKLRRVTGSEMCRFLERQGFELLRVRGSHHFYSRDELRTTVPVHGNRPLKIGTLRSILRDIQMPPADLLKKFVSDDDCVLSFSPLAAIGPVSIPGLTLRTKGS